MEADPVGRRALPRLPTVRLLTPGEIHPFRREHSGKNLGETACDSDSEYAFAEAARARRQRVIRKHSRVKSQSGEGPLEIGLLLDGQSIEHVEETVLVSRGRRFGKRIGENGNRCANEGVLVAEV